MNSKPVASCIEPVAHMMAYLDAFEQTMNEIDGSVVLVQVIDFAPVAALPYLAEQYNVAGVRGYAFCTSDEQRRALIKAAIVSNGITGTPYAIRNAIIGVGFAGCVITEGGGIFHNGIYRHDGAKNHRGGRWFNFSVEVFYTADYPDSQQIALVNALIGVYKNKRSVLFDLKFTLKS